MKKNTVKLIALAGIFAIYAGSALGKKIHWGKLGRKIGDGLEKAGHKVAKEAKEVGKEIKKAPKTAQQLAREAEQAVKGLRVDIPGIQRDVYVMQRSIKGIKGDVDSLQRTLKKPAPAGPIAQGKVIVGDIKQFESIGKVLIEKGKEAKDDIVSAIADPSKIAQVGGKLVSEVPDAINILTNLAKTHQKLFKDIDALQLKTTFDLATGLTGNIYSLFNAIQELEKHTGVYSDIVIRSNIRDPLKGLTDNFKSLATHTRQIYAPALPAKQLEMKLALGLVSIIISDPANIGKIINDFTNAFNTTEQKLPEIAATAGHLKNDIDSLKSFADTIKNRIRKNPIGLIKHALQTLQKDLDRLLSDLSILLLQMSEVIHINAQAIDNFNKMLGDNAILQQQSITAVEGVGGDLEGIADNVDKLKTGIKKAIPG